MNYIDKTLERINGVLLEQGCGLNQPELKDIGYIVANAIMAGIIDTSIIADTEQWLTNNQDTK